MVCTNAFWPTFIYSLILGKLDQDGGVLIVFDHTPADKTFELAVETIHAMNEVGVADQSQIELPDS